jgi:molybdenum cofactor cytidylyltransferase
MGVLSIINSNWENGLSSSIRAGVGALPQTCEGVMILFCDQILIETHHLMDLIETWNQDHSKIIACGYSDTVGVPVIIPAKYFSDIADLRGDYGAKSIIEKNIDDVVILDVPEAGCDIDTQEDMLELLSH